MNVLSWLNNWFIRRNPEKKESINPVEDYYKQGLVDSFGIIELIADIESHFSITFEDADFKKPEFRKINGLKNIVEQILTHQTLERIQSRFHESETHPFFISKNGLKYTYKDYWQYSAGLAQQWKNEGLKPGSIIALNLPNSFTLPCCYLACAIGGFVACPLVTTLNRTTIEKMIGYLKPDKLISENFDLISTHESHAEITEFKRKPNEPFLIMWTSGTTGEPKAIVHSFESILGSALSFSKLTEMKPDTRLYHVLPMTYMAGLLNTLFAPLMAGATIVEGPVFSPETALDFWTLPMKESVNTLSLIPTIASALCRLTRDPSILQYVKSGIRQIQCTSAPIPSALRNRFLKKFSVPLQNCYGITELGGPLSFQSFENALQDQDVSQLIAEATAIIKNSDELWIRSPFSMLGYSDQGKLVSPLDSECFFNTGDLGLMKGNQIQITGRIKDLIIRGGINVSPVRIESVLSEMKEIEEVAVIGKEHEFWGEEIIACVIPKTKGPDLLTNIKLFYQDRLGTHEQPDRIVFFEEFPRSFIGKILKNKLKEQLERNPL